MYTTGGTPVTWLIDRCAPGGMRQAHVARAAAAYLRAPRVPPADGFGHHAQRVPAF